MTDVAFPRPYANLARRWCKARLEAIPEIAPPFSPIASRPMDLLFSGLAVLLVVLGLGAVVEIVEYLVMLTVPNAGVGGYDNNMQDLIGNLLGGTLFVVLDCVRRSRRSRAASYAEP